MTLVMKVDSCVTAAQVFYCKRSAKIVFPTMVSMKDPVIVYFGSNSSQLSKYVNVGLFSIGGESKSLTPLMMLTLSFSGFLLASFH